MLHVERMAREDFDFAVSLTDTMNWDMAEEDFDFNMKLEPRGCFVLFDNSERIGVVTTINFGRVGWLGNLIVSENHRKKGAGALLAKHAISYLKAEKVETVGLYSYIDAVSFYRKLGFQREKDFIVVRGNGRLPRKASNARQAVEPEVQEIAEFDFRCLGFSRAKLLKSLLLNPDNFAYVIVENDELMGYAAAKVYGSTAQIGPVVCHRGKIEVAIDLVRAILERLESFDTSMCIPKEQKALSGMLVHQGFCEDFRVIRMFLGKPLGDNCVFAAESLERG
jgi:ribosomal protein S18 acetylase RimI-like enzyme